MTLELPGFSISKTLYESARSTIYLATRDQDGQTVALKILSAEYPSRQELARFQHEYHIQKKLAEINSVTDIYGIENYGNKHALVMQYIAGGNIASLMEHAGENRIELFFKLSTQIAETIGEIHRCYIIHKDINLRNILWDSDTETIRIIDFGIATELSREKPSHYTNLLNGSLPYISPEQTGRTNRSIDYRSDFYSLGVTLYKMLSGQFPFEADDDDPMAWIHCHIAREPKPLDHVDPAVAPALSTILNKLMEKNAEDRYQSGFSLKSDLEACWQEWKQTGIITNFRPIRQDISDRFEIPQKLFGREQEIATLLDSFSEISDGENKIFLVSGYSGIGKSALINEIHKPIIARQGYFITGKFDQFQRNIPYYAIAKAFRVLMRQLLAESTENLQTWKNKLLATLGPNGQVLINFIPELEQIIGTQPPVPHLGTEENQNRFNHLALQFLQLFSQPQHPLVMFIDDLQWVDSASLNLIKLFILNKEQGHFLFLGAYRDNEVNSHHPFISTVEEIKKAGIPVPHLILKPLQLEHLNLLISEAVYTEPERSLPLARLVLDKTGGNPFFINQFLKHIFETELLTFSTSLQIWQWDLDKIEQQQSSDNVVDLVLANMERLPQNTRNMLRHAACIGNIFELGTLSIIAEQDLGKTAGDLWPAVKSGLLITEGDNHTLLKGVVNDDSDLNTQFPAVFDRFIHDRVQQAAYSLIDEDQKQQIHLKIGRLLLKEIPESELENSCFDLVEHFNKSINLVDNPEERDRLAELNMKAGNKALDATAYAPALQYYCKGIEYLTDIAEDRAAKLRLEIEKGQLECYFLLNEVSTGIKLADSLLKKCNDVEDKVAINNLLILYYGGAGQMDKAIDIALESLRYFDIKIPRNPNTVQLLAELLKAKRNLGRSSTTDLMERHLIKDRDTQIVFSLLKELIAPTYLQGLTNLLPYIILRMFNLTLKHGNGPVASFAYSGYALLWSKLDDFAEAFRFGVLAMDYNKKIDNPPMEARCFFMSTSFALYWGQPLKDSKEPRINGLQKLIDTGEYFWASYLYLFGFWQEVALSNSLEDLITITEREIQFARKASQTEPYHVHRLHRNLLKNLAGQTLFPDSLDLEPGEETESIAFFESNITSTMGKFYHVVCRLVLHYYREEFHQALLIATRNDITNDVIRDGTFTRVIYTFYTCLSILAAEPDSAETGKHRQTYKKFKQKIRQWFRLCPDNFACMWYLIMAEEQRVKGRPDKAIAFYDQALHAAKCNDSLFLESLANELYARFWLQKGNQKLAAFFMTESGYLYYCWGAMGKLQLLKEKYPQLFNQFKTAQENPSVSLQTSHTLIDSPPTLISGTHDSSLDINTLVKASQTLSSEIVMEKLLQKLMHFLIENAGAQKGFLIFKEENGLFIEAECTLEHGVENFSHKKIALDNASNLSVSIVRFIARNKELLVLEDAANSQYHAAETYISSNSIKSILCLPLLDKSRLTGLLYLENNLVTHAFTPDRVEILKVLSAEIAIALENARLYRNLKEANQTLEKKVRERTATLSSMNDSLQNKNIKIQESKKIIEDYNRNITRSISYAKKIQDAILPHSEAISESFPEFFILFKPKQIVSGDFYWFQNIDNKIFVIVADCTGHGVPGAFLSMIGHMTLNKIILEQQVFSPALILGQLHEEIRTSLRQKGKKREAYEGMDIALCQIDRDNQSIIYAAAKRPLYLIRDIENQPRLTRIRGDRKSIGGRQKEKKRYFSDHYLYYSKGDMLYLSSDGLVDQHDKNDKKFGSAKLESLLENIAIESTTTQKERVLGTLDAFQGNESQRDDITLIGIKLT